MTEIVWFAERNSFEGYRGRSEGERAHSAELRCGSRPALPRRCRSARVTAGGAMGTGLAGAAPGKRLRLDETPVPVLSRDTITGENSGTGPGLQLLRKPFLKTRGDSKSELWQGCVRGLFPNFFGALGSFFVGSWGMCFLRLLACVV